jgi:hypothetical protein
MGYVMVSADFPGVTSEQRQKIYKCLEEKHWKKVTEFGRDISTVWYGYFRDALEDNAVKAAISNFNECSRPYCVPKLVLRFGPNEPKFSGLN